MKDDVTRVVFCVTSIYDVTSILFRCGFWLCKIVFIKFFFASLDKLLFVCVFFQGMLGMREGVIELVRKFDKDRGIKERFMMNE